MYKVDHSFRIGSQHLRSGMPCQDYALSGVTPQRAYAVVSDGCSSGGKTEIGAAITSLVTANMMRNTTLALDLWHIYDGISSVRYKLCLEPRDLLATCCFISVDDNLINIKMIGDGAVAWQEDDKLHMALISWANNMPLYPIYGDDNFKNFRTSHGIPEIKALTITDDQEIKTFQTELYHKVFNRLEHPNITQVAIFTDGICQVPLMNWRDVIRELMAFKSTEGDFVKRRLNRFCKEYHIIDDLAYACIQLGESNDKPECSS